MKLGDAAQPGPLAELLRHIEETTLRRGSAPATGGATGGAEGAAATASMAAEPQGLGYFRSTWQRLRVERQLNQSQAQVPENAGPLNSDRLVLRALHTLRDLSPAYLNHHMAYLDTLMWLEAADAAAPVLPAKTASGTRDSPRKTGRTDPKHGGSPSGRRRVSA